MQRVEVLCGDVDAEDPVDFPDARRAGDVDLGQVVADDVDPDQRQPLIPERRTDLLADPAVPIVELVALGGGTKAEVGSLLSGRRGAGDLAESVQAGQFAEGLGDHFAALGETDLGGLAAVLDGGVGHVLVAIGTRHD